MITLNPYDAKVAYSMIKAARKIKPSRPDYDPIEKYAYLWIAFNSIYQTIADFKGKSAQLKWLPNGMVETRTEGNLLLTKVEARQSVIKSI